MKVIELKNILQYKFFFENYDTVIWGAGECGNDLRAELKFYGIEPYVYDRNPERRCWIRRFIKYDEFIKLAIEKSINIIVAINDSRVVNSEVIPQIIKDFPSVNRVFLYKLMDWGEWGEIRNGRFFDGLLYNKLLDGKEACWLLRDYIMRGIPFLFSRHGAVEGRTLFYSSVGTEIGCDLICQLTNNAGFYPVTEESVKKYCNIVEEATAEIDILCIFQTFKYLEYLYKKYSPRAILTTSACGHPFFDETCWTEALKGLKVLVIHPFAELMDKQYAKREYLFECKKVLPEFELITYRAVQSIGGNDEFKDWFDALERMKTDISLIDFDIALIGCGAYGMPIGGFIKKELKKMAIHMGGTLQLLFGIKGQRWDGQEYQYSKNLYNKYWLRPGDELKPSNYQNVENGCYW